VIVASRDMAPRVLRDVRTSAAPRKEMRSRRGAAFHSCSVPVAAAVEL
jgi:hypothetical protein